MSKTTASELDLDQTLLVQCDKPMREAVERIARNSDRSMASVIRRAILFYLAKHSKELED